MISNRFQDILSLHASEAIMIRSLPAEKQRAMRGRFDFRYRPTQRCSEANARLKLNVSMEGKQ